MPFQNQLKYVTLSSGNNSSSNLNNNSVSQKSSSVMKEGAHQEDAQDTSSEEECKPSYSPSGQSTMSQTSNVIATPNGSQSYGNVYKDTAILLPYNIPPPSQQTPMRQYTKTLGVHERHSSSASGGMYSQAVTPQNCMVIGGGSQHSSAQQSHSPSLVQQGHSSTQQPQLRFGINANNQCLNISNSTNHRFVFQHHHPGSNVIAPAQIPAFMSLPSSTSRLHHASSIHQHNGSSNHGSNNIAQAMFSCSTSSALKSNISSRSSTNEFIMNKVSPSPSEVGQVSNLQGTMAYTQKGCNTIDNIEPLTNVF